MLLRFAWHPNGQLLSYTIEDGPQNQLITVNIETLESSSKDIFQIDKILSMDYAPDGRTMIWSGLRNGQSDLYLYQVLGNNQTALWNDPYNDLDPVFSLDGNSFGSLPTDRRRIFRQHSSLASPCRNSTTSFD